VPTSRRVTNVEIGRLIRRDTGPSVRLPSDLNSASSARLHASGVDAFVRQPLADVDRGRGVERAAVEDRGVCDVEARRRPRASASPRGPPRGLRSPTSNTLSARASTNGLRRGAWRRELADDVDDRRRQRAELGVRRELAPSAASAITTISASPARDSTDDRALDQRGRAAHPAARALAAAERAARITAWRVMARARLAKLVQGRKRGVRQPSSDAGA